jgi:hypothetical protein
MTWLRIGLAVRTAIDINIHRVALLRQSREGMSNWVLRNILRTWLACYIVDRTVSSQLGKPPSVRGENGIRSYLELVSQSETGKTVDDVWVAALAVSTSRDALLMPGMDPDSLAQHRCLQDCSWRSHLKPRP